MGVKVILYSAVWCPHCISFLPIWKEVADKLDKLKIKNIRYEDPKDAEIMAKDKEKYGWSGVPTLIVVTDNNHYKYEGDKNVNDIMNFINTIRNKSDTEQTSKPELKRCSLMSIKNPVATQQGGCNGSTMCNKAGGHDAKYYFNKYRKYKKKYKELKKI